MFKSKLLATALTAAAFMGLAALPLAGSGAARADEPTIGLAVANLQANFFNQIKQSVEAEAKLKGVQVVVVDAHGDSATQVNEIQDLITRGVKALIYIPAGATAAGVPVRAAQAAHIPVIAVDRNAPDAPADTSGGKGVLAIIQGQLGTTPENDRNTGFNEAMANCPGIKLVAKQASQEWSQAEGFNIAQDMLQRHPDITIFFGRADALALGAAQAVKVANLGHPVIVVGFDGDTAGLIAVKDGVLAATMTQKTQAMGRLALDSALELMAGKTLPKEQLQSAVLTTKDNVGPFIAQHP
jgi:ribose transport system substrate-binding protein